MGAGRRPGGRRPAEGPTGGSVADLGGGVGGRLGGRGRGLLGRGGGRLRALLRGGRRLLGGGGGLLRGLLRRRGGLGLGGLRLGRGGLGGGGRRLGRLLGPHPADQGLAALGEVGVRGVHRRDVLVEEVLQLGRQLLGGR